MIGGIDLTTVKTVIDLDCRFCSAKAGERCKRADGKDNKHSHVPRWNDYHKVRAYQASLPKVAS